MWPGSTPPPPPPWSSAAAELRARRSSSPSRYCRSSFLSCLASSCPLSMSLASPFCLSCCMRLSDTQASGLRSVKYEPTWPTGGNTSHTPRLSRSASSGFERLHVKTTLTRTRIPNERRQRPDWPIASLASLTSGEPDVFVWECGSETIPHTELNTQSRSRLRSILYGPSPILLCPTSKVCAPLAVSFLWISHLAQLSS